MFDHRGERLATCDGQGTIRVWNLTNGECLVERPKQGLLLSQGLAFSPNGRTIVHGSAGVLFAPTGKVPTNLKVWDAAFGQDVQTLRG